jgi:antitoxin (DNA-binding transcriptional repressor) of toxin-antitoxin stability system
VESGRTITITRRAQKIARLVPVKDPMMDPTVFSRIRAMRERLSLGKGESAKELINAGRRI